ncbi:TlpA disulfide reductase family protein [Paraflavitalea sp. CAU 1676]|uniref:TlpA family protein disulfide reductase n=1 Tax=Paraflavitalea sp. CAU 1676 TaxID=3032598 RepID=UPI0023DA364C|nr:TlpA disulfide reductase family protein [Paraflavitalea sp. CAU 1676]MDF2188673.1 TlpA disulfide reductase family protein [Paraflavitalea sp. CAU 1676]
MRNIVLMLLIVAGSCKEPVKEKQIIPQDKKATIKVRLTDLNDTPINLDEFKGKTVFLNFWATWCKPCIQEMPSIAKAQQLLGKKDVIFLLASNETSDQINEFTKEHKYDLKYVRLINLEELNMEGLPTTYIFNSKGELAFSETGYRKWDDTSNIEMILKINNQK